MLEQFVAVMPGTLGPALLVMCMSVMLTVGEGRDKPISSRWRLWGILIGLVAAIVFAGLRASAVINQRTFINYPVLWCCVVIDLLLIVLVFVNRLITRNWRRHAAVMHLANLVAALGIALTVFYALPDVILQLTIWVEPGDPIFTSDMLLRALGFVLGIIASAVIAAVFRTMRSTAVRPAFLSAVLVVLVIQLMQHLTGLLQIMQARTLRFPHIAFVMLAWLINNKSGLIMAQAFIFLIPAVASVVAGLRMPVSAKRLAADVNAATVRKHKAFRRRAIAAAAWSVVAMIGVTATLTLGVAAINQQPTLSPPEAYSLKDGVATIPFSQVEDGHLHRFEYKAKDGTVMRFIIIKKNGGAYGIGLDACENCGDDDNSAIYISSSVAQVLSDLPDSVDKIEVKALTTPENDLARKAAQNPAALSQDEWETWYCTAYPSSIAYQIEEVIPGAVAKQVRQVAALQGNVLQKTQAVMILMTVLSLLAAAVAVANLMVASIGERSSELALLKAIGATDGAVSRLMMAETAAISLLGAIVGAALGSGVAQIIGQVVFGSGITMRPMVFVLVFVLLALTVLLASASSIRSILSLKPAEVLHGR